MLCKAIVIVSMYYLLRHVTCHILIGRSGKVVGGRASAINMHQSSIFCRKFSEHKTTMTCVSTTTLQEVVVLLWSCLQVGQGCYLPSTEPCHHSQWINSNNSIPKWNRYKRGRYQELRVERSFLKFGYCPVEPPQLACLWLFTACQSPTNPSTMEKKNPEICFRLLLFLQDAAKRQVSWKAES